MTPTKVYSNEWWRRVNERAAHLGVTVKKSNLMSKKLMARKSPKDEWIYFGARLMGDYLSHGDEKRRASYHARHSEIRLSDGSRAIDRIMSPAWLSWHILW